MFCSISVKKIERPHADVRFSKFMITPSVF